jgi:hypothetical protein
MFGVVPDNSLIINYPTNIYQLLVEHCTKLSHRMKKKVITTLIQFAISYLCERGLSAVLVIKAGQNKTKIREGQNV